MKKNITFSVDESVLSEVRVIAAKRQTTVNAIVRSFLEGLADEAERKEETRKRLATLIDGSTGRLGPKYKWNREELYEDRVFPRHKRSGVRGDRKTG